MEREEFEELADRLARRTIRLLMIWGSVEVKQELLKEDTPTEPVCITQD